VLVNSAASWPKAAGRTATRTKQKLLPFSLSPVNRDSERRSTVTLREQFLYHLAVHVRQAEVAPLEAVGQLRVIDAEQVQDGGLQIVD
jgi:hypothetical protein